MSRLFPLRIFLIGAKSYYSYLTATRVEDMENTVWLDIITPRYGTEKTPSPHIYLVGTVDPNSYALVRDLPRGLHRRLIPGGCSWFCLPTAQSIFREEIALSQAILSSRAIRFGFVQCYPSGTHQPATTCMAMRAHSERRSGW